MTATNQNRETNSPTDLDVHKGRERMLRYARRNKLAFQRALRSSNNSLDHSGRLAGKSLNNSN